MAKDLRMLKWTAFHLAPTFEKGTSICSQAIIVAGIVIALCPLLTLYGIALFSLSGRAGCRNLCEPTRDSYTELVDCV